MLNKIEKKPSAETFLVHLLNRKICRWILLSFIHFCRPQLSQKQHHNPVASPNPAACFVNWGLAKRQSWGRTNPRENVCHQPFSGMPFFHGEKCPVWGRKDVAVFPITEPIRRGMMRVAKKKKRGSTLHYSRESRLHGKTLRDLSRRSNLRWTTSDAL